VTLKAALEDVVAHPRKRALKHNDDVLIYYDDTWDVSGLRMGRDGGEEGFIGRSFGFGSSLFSYTDVVSTDYVVIDVDFNPFKYIT
jgi:hypothetical protein